MIGFTDEAATFLRDVVVARLGADAFEHRAVCPCQYGTCGHCKDLHRHERCTKHHHVPAGPDTYVQMRIGPIWAALTPVTVVGGPRCRWVCPCPCRPDGTLPHQDPQPVQGSLLDLLGGA